MNSDRTLGLAVAQMGPVHLADSREAVVRRLIEMLREARAAAPDSSSFRNSP